MESDEEWSMNKKLIDLSSKDIRKSVSIFFPLYKEWSWCLGSSLIFTFYWRKRPFGWVTKGEVILWISNYFHFTWSSKCSFVQMLLWMWIPDLLAPCHCRACNWQWQHHTVMGFAASVGQVSGERGLLVTLIITRETFSYRLLFIFFFPSLIQRLLPMRFL